MASQEEKLQKLLVTLHGIRIRQLIMFSGVALLAYDALLTFSQEYKYIWKAKWTPSKWLYLFFRYFALAWQLGLFSGVFLGVATDLSPKYCRIITQVDIIHLALAHQLAILTITVRTSALYQNQRSINLMLGAGYLLNFFGMLGLILVLVVRQKYERAVLDLNIGCISGHANPGPWAQIDWVPVVVFELFLCVLTIRRAVQQGQIFRTRITTVLYRDGFAYFAVVLFCGLFQFVLTSVFYRNPYFILIFWALVQSTFRAIVSITCCRMILNLRGVLTKPSEFDMSMYTTGERPNVSTMHFERGPTATVDTTEITSTGFQTASERDIVAGGSAWEIELSRLSRRMPNQE